MYLQRAVESLWYGGNRAAILLVPFAWVFRGLVGLRRLFYVVGVLPVKRVPVPVIVVGNLTVGGCGKTPLVLWLSDYLRRRGYRPGIISRGYGGGKYQRPQQVQPDSDPDSVGDEAVLLAARSGCPVAVGRQRALAALELVKHEQCDIILSDDGLQHYALRRDLEIAVIDGDRRFGNGYSLPAGPLREPISRLARCDIRVARGKAGRHEFLMQYRAGRLQSLAGDSTMLLQALQGGPVHAVAGIGNPGPFFSSLRQAGLEITHHIFPDHHRYQQVDFSFAGDGAPIIMTEKDAIKCRRLNLARAWYLPIEAQLAEAFVVRFDRLLEEKIRG
ncbi:MAG: tetraacyldisaccharide 4'-kinase [Gammaproteobacteria bacterium]